MFLFHGQPDPEKSKDSEETKTTGASGRNGTGVADATGNAVIRVADSRSFPVRDLAGRDFTNAAGLAQVRISSERCVWGYLPVSFRSNLIQVHFMYRVINP